MTSQPPSKRGRWLGGVWICSETGCHILSRSLASDPKTTHPPPSIDLKDEDDDEEKEDDEEEEEEKEEQEERKE